MARDDSDRQASAAVAFAVIELAAREFQRHGDAAHARTARACIAGQLEVLCQLGYGEEPSDADLAAVRAAAEAYRGRPGPTGIPLARRGPVR